VNLHDREDLAQLLEHRWAHLERLATSTEVSLGKSGLAALKSTAKLPALSAIEMFAPPRGWLASTKFGKRLREVVLGLSDTTDERGIITWLPELDRLPVLETATIHASRSRDTYPRWTFARDAKHELSIATVVTTVRSFSHAVSALQAMSPTQLTALTVTLVNAKRDGSPDATQRAAMTAATKRQTRLSDRPRLDDA
ncbi:MAG: hypothetical protein H0V17_11145, partial [Deltaproteobacteria bacterium]|nr:hypothetical protein [Deltaproteobacteria bacterium]